MPDIIFYQQYVYQLSELRSEKRGAVVVCLSINLGEKKKKECDKITAGLNMVFHQKCNTAPTVLT